MPGYDEDGNSTYPWQWLSAGVPTGPSWCSRHGSSRIAGEVGKLDPAWQVTPDAPAPIGGGAPGLGQPSPTPGVVEFRGVLEVVRPRHRRREPPRPGHPRGASRGCSAPTGAGKSTLLQLATGQLRPSQWSGARARPSRVEQPRAQPLYRPLPRAGRRSTKWMTGRQFDASTPAPGSAASARARPARPLRPGARPRQDDRARRPPRSAATRKGSRQRTKLRARRWSTTCSSSSSTSPSRAPTLSRGAARPDGRDPPDGRRGQERDRVEPRAPRGPGRDASDRPPEPRPARRRRGHPPDPRLDRHAPAPDCPGNAPADGPWQAKPSSATTTIVGVELRRDDGAILVETRFPDRFYGRLAAISLEGDTPIEEVYSDDDNLEAVFNAIWVNSHEPLDRPAEMTPEIRLSRRAST